MSIVNCQYRKYYSPDNPIILGSILYANNTSPLRPVSQGYYATSVGTNTGVIYKVNNFGVVLEILSPDDTDCSNFVPESYLYYKAKKYTCGACIYEIEEVYVRMSNRHNALLNYYYTTGFLVSPDDNQFVYKIVGSPELTINTQFDATIDYQTESVSCARACRFQ